jgi:hypothetical protein
MATGSWANAPFFNKLNFQLAGETGQAATEYILLLAVIFSIFLMITGLLGQQNLSRKFIDTLSGPFAAAYQYGHVKVKGPNNGGPSMHPRVESGGNFRIFIFSRSQ